MPNPTRSDVYVSSALTNMSVAFMQDANAYVARRAFPVIPVTKEGGKFYVWSREDMLRIDAERRAAGAESAGGGVRLNTDTYFTDRDAIHYDIADPVRANADPAVNLERVGTEWVTDQVLRKMESRWASEAMSTSASWDGASSSTFMTGLAAPGSTSSNFLRWNDDASEPIKDIEGEKDAVLQKTGRVPNVMILGRKVWTALKTHPDIEEKIKYTQTGVPSPQLLASMLDLDEVMVANAVQNTANEGASAGTYSFMEGNHALLLHRAATPGLEVPTAGYTFLWTAGTGVPRTGVRIKRFRLERNESDRIEAESWYDMKTVSSVLGALFASAVSTS